MGVLEISRNPDLFQSPLIYIKLKQCFSANFVLTVLTFETMQLEASKDCFPEHLCCPQFLMNLVTGCQVPFPNDVVRRFLFSFAFF